LKNLVTAQGAARIAHHEAEQLELAEYFGKPLREPVPMAPMQIPDHMGWHAQGDGRWFLGVPVDGGRIGNFEYGHYRSGFYELVEKFTPDVILTADQNIIFSNINEADKSAIEGTLKAHNIKLREEITNVHRYVLACVALPTCGLALAEAERVQYPLVKTVEDVLKKHDLLGERISVRITGCPNGCARPYLGDIGLVGRTPGHYALFIGGDFEGTRLNTKIIDRFPYENIFDVLDVLIGSYVKGRKDKEGFGDFAHRVGEKILAQEIEAALGQQHKWAKAC
jgi:sulfite reductase (ferredoxin)